MSGRSSLLMLGASCLLLCSACSTVELPIAPFNHTGTAGKTGLWITAEDSTDMVCVQHYRADRLHGDYTTYFPSGALAISGGYRKGRRHGRWTQYRPSGEVSSIRVFRRGKLRRMVLYNLSW